MVTYGVGPDTLSAIGTDAIGDIVYILIGEDDEYVAKIEGYNGYATDFQYASGLNDVCYMSTFSPTAGSQLIVDYECEFDFWNKYTVASTDWVMSDIAIEGTDRLVSYEHVSQTRIAFSNILSSGTLVRSCCHSNISFPILH